MVEHLFHVEGAQVRFLVGPFLKIYIDTNRGFSVGLVVYRLGHIFDVDGGQVRLLAGPFPEAKPTVFPSTFSLNRICVFLLVT